MKFLPLLLLFVAALLTSVSFAQPPLGHFNDPIMEAAIIGIDTDCPFLFHGNPIQVTYTTISYLFPEESERRERSIVHTFNEDGLLISQQTWFNIHTNIYDEQGRLSSFTSKFLDDDPNSFSIGRVSYSNSGEQIDVVVRGRYRTIWQTGKITKDGSRLTYTMNHKGDEKTYSGTLYTDTSGQPSTFRYGADSSFETIVFSEVGEPAVSLLEDTSFTGTYCTVTERDDLGNPSYYKVYQRDYKGEYNNRLDTRVDITYY